MKLEPTLHKALLAGVGRVPLTPDSVAGPALQDLLAAVPGEARLWHSVAATDLWQRAGFEPGKAAIDPACPDEPAAPRAAEQVLQMILRGIHADLLGSWLAQAKSANTVLPHSCLLTMVERAVQHKPLRSAVAPVLGQRGRWLVAQNPDWADAFGVDMTDAEPTQSWELGSLAQRVATLHAMRRSDPQAALSMLEADWAQEPVESRTALLPCLATGISLADEPFLERALDDKRKEVRTAAQQLLAALPGSQLGERCKARLLACFAFEAAALTVTLPAEVDKAMKRDGIGGQNHYGMGEKAGWLLELMRCVPPAFWSERWQLAPPDVINLFAKQEFNVALVTGLAQAAGRALGAAPGEAAVAWFVALIGYDAPSAALNMTETLLPDLERLPMPEQERIVTGWLAHADRHLQAFSYAMRWAGQRVGENADTLPQRLSELMLGHLQRHMLAVPKTDYSTRGYFQALGRVLGTGNLAYATANWPPDDWEHWPQWRPLFDELMETLTFRHTMQASFLENHA